MKDLPFFKFEPSVWISGDISLEDYTARGVFIDICAFYWQRECNIDIGWLRRRYSTVNDILDILINNELILVENDQVIIKFLDNQLKDLIDSSEFLSKMGKKGAEKRWGKHRVAMGGLKGGNGKIEIEEEIKKKKNNIVFSNHFSDKFKSTFNDYLDMRKKIKKQATDNAIKLAIKQLDKHSEQIAIEMLEQSILNSWSGLFPIKQQKEEENRRGYERL